MTERRERPLPFTQTGNGANTLVFIHGFLDDASFWRSTIQALEAREPYFSDTRVARHGKSC